MDTAFSGTTTLSNVLNKQQQLYSALRPQQNSAINSPISNLNDDVSIGILTPEKTQALLNLENAVAIYYNSLKHCILRFFWNIETSPVG